MKKFVIGLGVFGVFLAYSVWVRHELPTIAKPASLAAAPNTSASNTTSQSAASGGNAPDSTTNNSSSMGQNMMSQYKNGTFTGSVEDAYYGNVQVSATISGGKIADVAFLQYPDTHDTSVMINQQAMPYLKQEALQTQNADVQVISGATFTSQAFVQSLASALRQAN